MADKSNVSVKSLWLVIAVLSCWFNTYFNAVHTSTYATFHLWCIKTFEDYFTYCRARARAIVVLSDEGGPEIITERGVGADVVRYWFHTSFAHLYKPFA